MCSLGIHSYGDNWEVSSYATCTEAGVRRRVCTVCGQGNVTEEIPATGHNYGPWHDLVNTCTEHTQTATCINCNSTTTQIVKVNGHVYKNGSCINCGAKQPAIDNVNLDRLNGSYGRDYLVRKGKQSEVDFYDRLNEAATTFHNGETVAKYDDKNKLYIAAEVNYKDLGISSDRAIAIWQVFKYDTPAFYWISTTATYSSDYLNLICAEEYHLNETRAATTGEILSTMGEWLAEVNETASDYQKALTIHDTIVKSISYARDEHGVPESADWAHCIEGAFGRRRSGVCEAYAKSFQIMLNYCGIENVLVTGGSKTADGAKGEDHAWNLVKIDGSWYWCDLTWDDVPSSEFGVAHHNFMVNDSQNVNWRDWNSTTAAGTFTKRHIASTERDKGVKFLYSLPDRARSPYSGSDAIRTTFEVKDGKATATYSINGYDSVQLVKATGFGELTVPEVVEYGNMKLSVVAIGAEKDGVYVSGTVLDDNVTKVTVSNTVQAIYEGALVSPSVIEYAVAKGNTHFVAQGGALFSAGGRTLAFYPAASTQTKFTLPAGTVGIAASAIKSAKNLSVLDIGACEVTIGIANVGAGLDEGGQRIGNFSWGHVTSECAEDFKVVVSADNAAYRVVGDGLYDASGRLLLVMDRTLRTFIVPKGTTAIDGYAFYGLTRLLGTITYDGTSAEWRAVDKATNWNFVDGKSNVGKVTCSDTVVSV